MNFPLVPDTNNSQVDPVVGAHNRSIRLSAETHTANSDTGCTDQATFNKISSCCHDS